MGIFEIFKAKKKPSLTRSQRNLNDFVDQLEPKLIEHGFSFEMEHSGNSSGGEFATGYFSNQNVTPIDYQLVNY